MDRSQPVVIPAILGPTAVGKTELAIHVAVQCNMEIVSCDSRQVYRFMDIGTAKPTYRQRQLVRHWMLDVIDPSRPFSAHDYALRSRAVIRARLRAGRRVIVCGGTGLYYKSLSEGLGVAVAANPSFRQYCEAEAAAKGPESLYQKLTRVDPLSARRLHPNDLQRVIRALQVYHDTGIPMSKHVRKGHPPSGMTFAPVILMLPREQLYDRINRRVHRMVADGLWEEFLSLRAAGFGREHPAMTCVGYAELFDVEEGRITMAEAVEKIQLHTRHFAKRQITWFVHQCCRALFVDMSLPGAVDRIHSHIASLCGR